jgi:hypothetical protein
MLFAWMLSSTMKKRPDPRSTLLPLFVMRFRLMPPVSSEASLPPVWIWISSNASKS